MKINKSQLSKESIIETTLCLIDENEGIKNVTLRDIAKSLGCAHTNLYNYFGSLDEIFWEALAQALIKMIDDTAVQLNGETNYGEKLNLILARIIDFSMDHPGWYRLIWLESMNGVPSPKVVSILNMPGKEFIEAILKANNSKISDEKANMIGEIMHGYVHGELCKWISNRSFIKEREKTKIKILSNVKHLYKSLLIE